MIEVIADDDGAERRLAHGNREFCLPQGKLHKVCVGLSELQHQVCSSGFNDITRAVWTCMGGRMKLKARSRRKRSADGLPPTDTRNAGPLEWLRGGEKE